MSTSRERLIRIPSAAESGLFSARAKGHYLNGNFDEALNDAEQAVTYDKTSVKAHLLLAYTLYKKYNTRTADGVDHLFNAAKSATRAIELNPNLAESYRLRALILSLLNLDEKALNDASKAVELNRFDRENYITRARVLQQTGDHENALLDLNRAIRTNPLCKTEYIMRAESKFALRQYDSVIHDISQAVANGLIRNSKALFLRGQAYVKLEQYDLALNDFNACRRLPGRDKFKSLETLAKQCEKVEEEKLLDLFACNDFSDTPSAEPSQHIPKF
jgi:tetratricopeptide (TPR) repeat protein